MGTEIYDELILKNLDAIFNLLLEILHELRKEKRNG